MDWLSERFLGHKTIPFAEVAGAGRNFIGFARAPIDKATQFAAEDADVTLRLWRVLKPRLVAEGLTTVYETLERALVVPLRKMETRGISIDRQILSRLSGEFAQGMERIEAEIQAIVGAPFNPGSPKQLGDILFGQMGLPGGKKTATGAWSTSASVLEDLGAEGHELPRRILDWRQSRSSDPPTPTRCPITSIRARVVSTPPTRWLRRRSGARSPPARRCRSRCSRA